MRDKCREVIVEEEGDFVRKAEELVWKKAYHDVMQFYKRVKKVSFLKLSVSELTFDYRSVGVHIG